MARAIWKGVLRFAGDASLPVKLYSAVEDRAVHFRLLHAADQIPVKQRMVDPESGEEVPYAEARKGFEVEPGRFVLLEAGELDSLEPAASRDIELLRFVPADAIGQQWYERPYFLGPDGEVDDDYRALVTALERSGREGVARWTMRKSGYLGALRADDGLLKLVTLRHAGEVVPVSSFEAPPGRELDAREVKMAEQLVGMLAGEFDPSAWRDTYRERVRSLIEAKTRGAALPFKKKAPRRREASLADALEASIAGMGKERRSA